LEDFPDARSQTRQLPVVPAELEPTESINDRAEAQPPTTPQRTLKIFTEIRAIIYPEFSIENA
jgi:hypothetical protein